MTKLIDMRKIHVLTIAAAVFVLPQHYAFADGVYAEVGFPGITAGYNWTLNDNWSVRAEYTGGLSASRNGQRNGLTYTGDLKLSRASVLGSYHFGGTGWRATAGLNANDTKFTLDANGSTGTINGKSVNLTGENFNLQIKQPNVTPYIGVGYGFAPKGDKGWGFTMDFGFSVGKFKTSTTTTIVGKQGITQADVDAEVNKVRDSVNKLSALPTLMLGVSYSF